MKTPDNHRVFKMSFAGVYPHYVAKVEKKGRTTKEHSLMRNIRYMDKLVDELAKGRPMEKILRT